MTAKYTVYGKEVRYLLNDSTRAACSLDDLVRRSCVGAVKAPFISKQDCVCVFKREGHECNNPAKGHDLAVWRLGDDVYVAECNWSSCELVDDSPWEYVEVDKNVDLTDILVLATLYSQMVPA